MSNEAWLEINIILQGYKDGNCKLDKSVELLRIAFEKLPPDAQGQFFDILQGQLFSETFSYLRDVRTVHHSIIRAWASFGPADSLPGIVFALLSYDTKERMESWARVIGPEFLHSLATSQERFSSGALDLIRSHAALISYQPAAASSNMLLEVASRIERGVGLINFARFEEALMNRQAPSGSDRGDVDVATHDLRLQILRLIAKRAPGPVNKFNFLGRPPAKGEFEMALGRDLGADERNRAYRVFDELKNSGHITPTYADLSDPESWVTITERGRQSVKTGAIDSLDEILAHLAPHLIGLRRGAWSALQSGEPHSLQQAAHSARELVDQVLKIGAPDQDIKQQTWYASDESSASGVTRRMRLRFLAERYGRERSQTDLKIAERAADFLLAVQEKVLALAHSRIDPDREEVEAAVASAEIALKTVLTSLRSSKGASASG